MSGAVWQINIDTRHEKDIHMDPHRDFPVRYSLAPGAGHEILTIAGTTEKTFATMPRAVMIMAEWLTGDDLEVKYTLDATFTTIASPYNKAFKEGGVYPLAWSAFKSSAANETTFTIMGII